ncbi:MAG TPA: flagellar protein FlaG [Spirochaetia bacterium]|nr:flagellar protein FlaG [Spirochaetia bacterium]
MALDVSSISSLATAEGARQAAAALTAAGPKARPAGREAADLGSVMADLQRVSATFNRRLSFSMNEKLGQVVVKVIDADTDKVVKEIPPEELQHVYERIREVIGLLLDEQA